MSHEELHLGTQHEAVGCLLKKDTWYNWVASRVGKGAPLPADVWCGQIVF